MVASNLTAVVGDGNALAAKDGGRLFVLKTTIDCSENNISADDIVKLWNIPAKTLVLDVIVDVTTVEDSTCTLTLGDYLIATPTTEVDLDGYEASMNAEAAASYRAADGAAAYALGRYYRDALAYIGLLFNNAADTAVIEIMAICVDCR